MNAPQTVETTGYRTGFEDALEHLPLNCMVVSSTDIQRRRRASYDAQALLELAATIKTNGVVEPIVVRPWTGSNVTTPAGVAPKFEIVAGERRWIAADRAGLGHIPAIIRELTDDRVLEIQLIENVQREGLSALEEGAGYKALMDLKHSDAEAVGAMVGKSRSYVYSRIKLLDLHEPARAALQSGELDASKALLVARITNEKEQAKALKKALEKNWRGETISYKALFAELREKHMIALAGAPWALDDASLFRFEKIIGRRGEEESIPLPACIACPQFSGNDPELAEGLPQGAHVCTGADCYAAKLKDIARKRRSDAKALGVVILDGEAAKKIAPRKDALVGFVDLDTPCENDEDPSPPEEPKQNPGEDDAAYDARLDAFYEAQPEYQPRTYRALLQDQLSKLDITRIEDPKTKLIRELVRAKDAREILAKAHDIQLPGSVGKAPAARPSPHDYQAEQAKRDEAQRQQREREAVELEYRRAVLAAIMLKCNGPLKRDDLVDIADTLLGDWQTKEAAKAVLGKAMEPADWKEADLPRLIRILLIANTCRYAGRHPGPLLAAAKRWKVDTGKVKKDLAAKAKASDDKPPADKPAAKKKAAKK